MRFDTRCRIILIAWVLTQGVAAQPEIGVLARSDGAEFAINAIPSVTLTFGGNLLAAWTAHRAESQPKLRIVGAMSSDSGRMWSAPFPLIDNPGKTDADPSLVVDGKRIILGLHHATRCRTRYSRSNSG